MLKETLMALPCCVHMMIWLTYDPSFEIYKYIFATFQDPYRTNF